MTFSHISDMHLGQTQYGSQEREDDMYGAFKQAIDISIKDHVEFVILAGDLFDKPKPEGRAIVTLGNELIRLHDNNIPVYFILGEHDISRVSATPVSYVYHNFKVANYIGDGVPLKNGNTMIVGFDKMRRDEIPNHADNFARVGIQAQKHTGPKILVMHQGVIEINKFAGEIATNELPKSFSYYAMGHLHNKTERHFENLGGTLAYPGSTEMASSEGINDSEKGFYQVDLDCDEASTSWIKLDTRPHKVFSLTDTEFQNNIDSMLAKLLEYTKKPVVKIKVRGDRLDMNKLNALAKSLHEASLYCNIIPEQNVERTEIMTSKPSKIRDELIRHTKKSVNDDSLAEFAINELLPLLASNRLDDALSLVIDDYEKAKLGEKK